MKFVKYTLFQEYYAFACHLVRITFELQLTQEERRTKAIRRRELEAATAATKTRKGMERARELDYITG